MKTKIKTVHEETYSDNSKTLGVLLNYNEEENFKESLTYIFNNKDKMYIFFNSMIDLFDYLLYGEKKMKRAYIKEEEFDKYFDLKYIDGTFSEILKWC